MLKRLIILLTIVLPLITYAQRGTSRYGYWGYGITGSFEYFLTSLVDAPRFDIDSNLALNMTDAQYLEHRKLVDQNSIGYTAGILAQYRMRPKIVFETGLRLVKAGTKIDGTKITDPNFLNAVGSNLSNKTVLNSYNIIEIPLIIRHRIGQKPRFELGMAGAKPMVTKKRYFFYSYGLGIGIPLNNRDLYNRLELHNMQGNVGVAGFLELGVHQDINPYFFINGRIHGRATLLSYYEYAPIKSYFHAVGAEVKFGFRLPYKEKKEKEKEKSVKCATFQSTPVPDGRNIFVMGFRYGLNVNMLSGTDASSSKIALKGKVSALEPDIESATGGVSPTLSPHAGLHMEYLFHPLFSVAAIPTYTQRGYVANYTYFLTNGNSIKSRQRVYLDYFEMPLRINYYPTNRLWVHASAIVSFNTSNRLYNYYQHFQGEPNLAVVNDVYKAKEKVKDVFDYSPDKFILGYGAGVGYHVDENFSVSLQGLMFEPIFVQDSGRENFFHFVPQLSLYYFFLTK